MEGMCLNEHVKSKPSSNHTGPRISERCYTVGVTVFLVLMSVFLLVGIVVLGVLYGNSAAELSAVKHNQTKFVRTSKNKLSSMTKERDLLNSKLSSTTEERNLLNSKLSSMTEERNLLNGNLSSMTEERNLLNNKLSSMTEEINLLNSNLSSMTEERDLLNSELTEMTEELQEFHCLSEQNNTCPAGWNMFNCSCYFLSEESGSWDEGREDCRDRGADLVVIDSSEEQMFLAYFTNKATWIGLNDSEVEGTWEWVDGTPLTLQYWDRNQPDNGGGNQDYQYYDDDEDCVHFVHGYPSWNDISCATSLQWICEKMA